MAIIDAARRITWQGNVGVSGGIPARTTTHATAAAGDGVTDDAATIQSEIDGCPVGETVLLGAGTYMVSTGLRMKSGVTLRGAGAGTTTIKGSTEIVPWVIGFVDIHYGGGFWETAKDISGSITKGATTLTVNGHGYSAGDLIIVDALVNAAGDPPITNVGDDGTCTWCGREDGTRPIGQMAVVGSVTDENTIELELPLYYGYDTSKTPQTCRVAPTMVMSAAGLEDLTVDNSLSVANGQVANGTIHMVGCIGCWIKGVEVDTVLRNGIQVNRSYRPQLLDCEVHVSTAYTSSAGYGLAVYEGVSAGLFENCYLHDLTVGIILNGPISGNVFGYNYITDMKSTTYPTAVRDGIVLHGAHSLMNLFEGNYLDGNALSVDLYWGTSSHNTFHRNFIAFDATKTAGTASVQYMEKQTYNNLVGNVIGNDTENEYESDSLYSGNEMIYYLEVSAATLSLLRHGNWDYYTDGVVWDGSIEDHAVPDSYYLATKPSWWGTGNWPLIGPDLTPVASRIPADPAYVEVGDPTTYRVYYNRNGVDVTGDVPTDATEYDENYPVTVAAVGTLAKYTYYAFTGWNTAADGSGTDYAPGATMTMPAADVTLYAQWMCKQVLVLS